ncbi:MAG: glycosyltransferase [Prevotella sp.]|nr:glycosyltransferase [Prevotella sp.]
MQNQRDHTQVLQAQPLVSFVVTAYNLPATMLRECVESILALSMRPQEREIILVDDGSDETPLTELKDLASHLIYYRQDNQGVSAARNAGLRIASGQFFQFVDGDDRLIPENYEHCLEILRSKQPDMLLFSATTSTKTAKSNLDCQGPFHGDDYMRHHNIRAAVWSYVFHRSLIGNLHFTVNKQFTEDEEFTPMLLLRSEKLYKTEVKAYFYRQHQQSATHQKSEESLRKRFDDSIDTILRLNDKADRMPQSDRQAMQRRVAQLTMDYIYNIIVETRDRDFLNEQLKELERNGLFPLPDRNYTKKYSWFRRMTNSQAGLRMLMLALPHLKRER